MLKCIDFAGLRFWPVLDFAFGSAADGMTEMAPICGTTEATGVRPGSAGKAIPCNEV
jgi:hypothetical protein